MKFLVSQAALALLSIFIPFAGAETLRGLYDQGNSDKCDTSLMARIKNPTASRCEDGVCGTVIFRCAQTGQMTEIKYDLTGLSPGRHALHVHENRVDGDCLSTGGHWNPTGENHGGNLE